MLEVIDILGFLCDGVFACLYLGITEEWKNLSFARRAAVCCLLLSTLVFYPVRRFQILNSNFIRYMLRFFIYTCVLFVKWNTNIAFCLYRGASCAAVYTLCHNILLTPITQPLLSAQVYFTDVPVLNALICSTIVYGIKTIIYAWVCNCSPLHVPTEFSTMHWAVLAAAVITGIYAKKVQQITIQETNFRTFTFSFSAYFILLQIALLLCLVLFEQYQRKLSENIAWRFQAITARSLLKNLQLRREQDDTIRHLRHDLRNHMLTLQYYIQNGDENKALAYVESFLHQIQDGAPCFQTGNNLLDMLLSEKLTPVVKGGIEVSVSVDFRLGSFLDDFTLCVIVGNALDNAIEACDKITQEDIPFIKIWGGPSANQMLLRVSNSCKEQASLSTYLPQSTKPDQEHHGFGLKSIERVLKPYHGLLFVENQKKQFDLTITIPIPQSILSEGNYIS